MIVFEMQEDYKKLRESITRRASRITAKDKDFGRERQMTFDWAYVYYLPFTMLATSACEF